MAKLYPFDGRMPVTATTVTEKVIEDGKLIRTVTKTVVGYEHIITKYADYNLWQAPKGYLIRNRKFQAFESELHNSVKKYGVNLYPLWEKLNGCATIEDVNLVEKGQCGPFCLVLISGKQGMSGCSTRGSACPYARLIEAAKEAILNP